jgi:regulator of sirC expression with transglutaminase-like and TPR domain
VDITEEWIRLMRLPQDRLRLDEAAFLIAAHRNPKLDLDAQVARLDEIASHLEMNSVDALCDLLFDTLGFRGDETDYADPRNSCLDEVLDRRLGIPITLAVLMLEVGRRQGIRLHGVGLPGHFLVRDPEEPDLLIDAFSGGRRLTTEDCAALLRAHVGRDVPLTSAMVADVGPWAILARMLANLTNSFRQMDDYDSLVWVTRLRVTVPGMQVSERVAAASALAEVGKHVEAAVILDDVAATVADNPRAVGYVQARAQALRAMLN